MTEIKIHKGDKYYSFEYWDIGMADDKPILWLSTEEGEGMEVSHSETVEKLYDAIDKFFKENM